MDETNLSYQYTRNRIRHEQLEKLTAEEIRLLQQEIAEKNRELKKTLII